MRTHFLLPTLLACTPATKAPAEGDNSAPSIEFVAPDYGSNFTIEEDIDFLATVSDEESSSETLMVSWTSDLNGDLSADLADGSGNAGFTSDPLIAGGHTITATAIDPDGAQASASILINIIDPGMPPVLKRMVVAPDPGVAGELLTLEAEVEDPDNDTEDLAVVFSISAEDVSSECDDQPDGYGMAQCQLTIDEHGVYTVIAQVTDPMGQTDTYILEDFEVIAADAHDGDGDGFAEIDGDCDDANASTHPDALEVPDGIDNNCDGQIDEGTHTGDDDGDGFTELDGDCDDDDSSVHPDATETCNEIDDDCNGVVDDDAEDASTWHLDSDGDGFGSESATTTACSAPPSYVADGTDCNDSDFYINPDATEVCDEEDTDEDCSGSADGWDASGKSYWYLDLDDDGYPTADIYEYRCDAYGSYIAGTGWWDCDDSRSDINPGMAERCDVFGLDEDCDGEVNEPGAEEGTYYFRDSDGDGFGDATHMEMLCASGDLTDYDTINNEDCCDSDYEANPDASSYRTIETGCGGHDWNCDGEETKQWTNTGSCGYCLTACCAEPPGWRYSAEPDCGNYADWVYDCSYSFPASCSKDYSAKTQACR